MAGNVKLMTSAGGGVVLDTATTTATDVTVKVPVTGVNNGTLVCSDSSGNVGIGTNSPSSFYSEARNLVVGTGTGGQGMTIYSGSASQGRLFFANSTSGSGQYNGFVQYNHSDNSLAFGTNGGNERMRIDSSGNLLVGTTNLIAKVSVDTSGQSGLSLRQVSTGGWQFLQNTLLNGGINYFTLFQNNGSTIGSITGNGTSTTYATSSDYRLKENIQPMQNALATVAQLNPVTYTWKADGSDGQGFIAHELQAVVPDCVTGEKDAVDEDGNPVYQGIDTSFLVATLTKAIQELSAKNDALEARIAALEAK